MSIVLYSIPTSFNVLQKQVIQCQIESNVKYKLSMLLNQLYYNLLLHF